MQRSSRLNRPGLKGSSRFAALLSSEGAGVVLKATPDTTTSIGLAWTESPLKPDNYRIESSGDGFIWSPVTTVSGTVLSYTNTGLIESTQYYYRIVPILGGVDQLASNVADTWTVPATPTSLTALTISSSQIDISWTDASTGNTGYVIERRNPPTTGTYATVGTAGATATSFSATGLTSSTQYQFRVAATNPATQSAYSNEVSATTNSATIPVAPTGVSASASTTAVAVTITWTDASSDEDGFYVYRNTSNTTTGATQVNSVAAGVQTYTDNATNNPSNPPAIGTVYYYWVSAYNGAGESTKVAASQNATGGVTTLNVPAAPTGLTATGVSTTQIDLAWTDADATETGFIIERRSPAGSGSYSQIATTGANVQTFNNTGLTESVQYEYRVAATNAAGNSAYSNTASKYTIPATPTGLTATAASSTQINLAWTDVSTGNTGQRIERRSPAGSGSYSTLTTVSATATSYSDTGLTASTQYEYRIIATNPDYDSSPSTAASATTSAGGLSPSWSLDFSTGTPSGYTLTRASTGTYVDSSGYVASASTDVARLTHERASPYNRLGLLIEQQRTNEFQYSEDFANAYWSKSGTGINNNSGAFWTSPANTATAVLLRQNTSNSSHYLSRLIGSVTNATFSIFAQKQNTTGGSGRVGKYLTLQLVAASGNYYHATFDLDAGTMTQAGTVGTTVTSGDNGIEAYRGGWYRIWVRGTRTSSGNMTAVAALATNDSNGTPTMAINGEVYTGVNATDGVYIWGAQYELANQVPLSYMPSTGAAATTREADKAHVLDSAITSWGDPGALVVHFYPPGQAGTLISTDDAATAQVGIKANSTTTACAFWSSGETSTGTIGSGVQKAVHYWNGSTSKFAINGSTPVSNTNNFTIANADFVTLGAEATDSAGVPGTFSQYANCIIRKVEFYSGTLTDGNLQTITT